MSTTNRDTNLRYLVDVEGIRELQQLVDSIDAVGGVSEETQKQVDALLSDLANSAKAGAAVKQYAELARTLRPVRDELEAARKNAQAFGRELATGSGDTTKAAAGFEAARASIAKLAAQETSLVRQQQVLRASLQGLGVDYRQLGSAQGQLAARAAQSRQQLVQIAAAAKQAAASTREQAIAQAQAEQAALRLVRANVASAAALRALEMAGKAGAQGITSVASASTTANGALASLRNLVAGAVGFLSLRSAVDGVKNILGLGDAAERARIQLANLFGGTRAGQQAYDQLRQLSRDLGVSFNGVREAAIRLKALGLDPLNGTLEVLINENAKMGGTQERLQGIILAVGQAWTKQKLQAEEALQLTERGVPVWDLLAKATGKNVTELQKLSTQGKLGRDVISALLAEIGKASEGAAKANIGLLSTQFNLLRDQVEQFFTLVANSGALDYFKSQLAAVLARVRELASNGQLEKFAKRVSDAIVGTAEAIKSGIAAIVQYRVELFALAAAYASVKTANFVAGLAQVAARLYATAAATAATTTATTAAQGAVSRFAGALAAIPKIVKTTLVLGAADFVLNQAAAVLRAYDELKAAQAEVYRAEAENASVRADVANRILEAKRLFAEAAAIGVKSSDDLARASEAEASAYILRLQQAQKYWAAIRVEANQVGNAEGARRAAEKFAELGAAIDAARDRMVQARAEVAFVLESIGKAGTAAADAFDKARQKGEDLRKSVDGLFKGIDFAAVEGFEKVLDIVTAISARGKDAGQAIRDELGEALRKVSDDDFPKVLKAAETAFTGAVGLAGQLRESVARISFERLGVDVDRIKAGFTDAGRAAVTAFRAAADQIKSLGLTTQQQNEAIYRAFQATLAKVSTSAELQALKDALQTAFNAGTISGQQFAAAGTQIVAKLAEIKQEAYAAAGGLGALGDFAVQTGQRAIAVLEAQKQAAAAMNAEVQEMAAATAAVGDATAGAAQAAGGAAAGFRGIIEELINEFNNESKVAGDYFKERLAAYGPLIQGTKLFSFYVNKAAESTRFLIAEQQSLLEQSVAAMDDFAATGVEGQNRLGIATRNTSADLYAQAAAVRAGNTELNFLNQTKLDALAASIEKAAGKLREMEDAAKSAQAQLLELTNQYKDAQDQREGNLDEIEKRRHAEELARIDELARVGGAAAQQQAAEARRLAEQEHKARLREIAEQQAAQNRADGGGSGSSGGGGSSTSASGGRPSGGASSGGVTVVNNISFEGSLIGDDKSVQKLVRTITGVQERQAALRN